MESGLKLGDLRAVVQLYQLHVPPVQLVNGVQHGVDVGGDLLKLVVGFQLDLVIHVALLNDAQLIVQRFHRAGVAAGDLSGHAEQGDEKHTEHEHGTQAADGVVGTPIVPRQQGIDQQAAHRGLSDADHIPLIAAGDAALSDPHKLVEGADGGAVAGYHGGAAGIGDHKVIGQLPQREVPRIAVQQQEGVSIVVQPRCEQKAGVSGCHVIDRGVDLHTLSQPREGGLAEIQQVHTGFIQGGKGRVAAAVQQKQVADPQGGIAEAVELVGHALFGDLAVEERAHDRRVVRVSQILGTGAVDLPEAFGELLVVHPVFVVGIALGVDGQQTAEQEEKGCQQNHRTAGDLCFQPLLKARGSGSRLLVRTHRSCGSWPR